MVVDTFFGSFFLTMLLITMAYNCSVKPTVCRVKLNNRWFNVSLLCNPEDPFQVAKIATSWNEGPLLFKTACNRDEDVTSVHCNFKNLSCTSIIDEFKDELLHQLNNKVSPQAVMERTFEKEALRLDLHRLQRLLQMFEGETIIYLSGYRDFDLISSSLDNYFFYIDNGMGLNTTLHHVYTKTDSETLYFVIFCPVNCIVDVLNQAFWVQTGTVFRSTHWIVIPTEGSTAADFLHYDTNIPAGDIVIVDLFIGTTESKRRSSTNIYRLEAPGEVRRVGCVDKKGNISLSEQLFSKKRNILSGKTLTVATLEWRPFVIKRIDNGTVTYEGVCMDLFNELARVLNFSYRLVEPEDGSFGSAENGRWNGLVGMLANKRVDFAVSPLTITQEREAVMDFTVPFFNLPSGIIIKTSNSNSNKWITLIAPFRSEVHICILFSLILSTVFLFVVEEVNPGNVWVDKIWFARGTRFGDILWNHFGALTANGGSYLPTTVSGRTILCCWWLFTVITAATYSGNLISFLTDWREKLPFTSLAEMVQQDTYKWGALGGSAYIGLFHNSSDADYQRIWETMQNNPLSLSQDIEQHRKLVDTEHYAYLGDIDTANSWQSEDCSIQFILDNYLTSYFSFGLQNNSIFNPLISEEMLRINELGLPDKWYKKWKLRVECETDKSSKRVDLLGLQSIFYAAGVGIVLSSIILFLELVFKKITKINL